MPGQTSAPRNTKKIMRTLPLTSCLRQDSSCTHYTPLLLAAPALYLVPGGASA